MKLLISIIFIISLNVQANENEIIEFLKPVHLQKIDEENNHICHLNNVYLERISTHGSFRVGFGLHSRTLVWNIKKNQPLQCNEYEEYIREMYNRLKNEK